MRCRTVDGGVLERDAGGNNLGVAPGLSCRRFQNDAYNGPIAGDHDRVRLTCGGHRAASEANFGEAHKASQLSYTSFKNAISRLESPFANE